MGEILQFFADEDFFLVCSVFLKRMFLCVIATYASFGCEGVYIIYTLSSIPEGAGSGAAVSCFFSIRERIHLCTNQLYAFTYNFVTRHVAGRGSNEALSTAQGRDVHLLIVMNRFKSLLSPSICRSLSYPECRAIFYI